MTTFYLANLLSVVCHCLLNLIDARNGVYISASDLSSNSLLQVDPGMHELSAAFTVP